MAKLEQKKSYFSPIQQSSIVQILREHTCEIDSFRVVAKLSAGGIVVRTLQAPDSDKLFFGILTEKIQIAELRYNKDITPYQPLLHIVLREEGAGTRLDIHFAISSEFFDIAILYKIAGILLCLASIPLLFQQVYLALYALIFGLLLVIYPILRSRMTFAETCASAEQKLRSLPLELEQR